MVVRFIIDACGSVLASRTRILRSDIGDPVIERCMLDVVHTWRFARPDGGGIVVVEYPFVFRRTIEGAEIN